jgi:hypothetical protein
LLPALQSSQQPIVMTIDHEQKAAGALAFISQRPHR